VAEYYPTDAVEDPGDGHLVVTLRARDEAWVRRLVISLGAAARVLAPAELAERVREDARQALSAYRV
jgi:predicted DNA-binding transcriptional regulator YafY